MKTIWLVRYNNGQADVFDEEQSAPAWPYIDAFEAEARIKELESFVSDFIDAWEDGTAGDGSIYNKAKGVL
jgi:hypothetical protein